MKWIIKIINFFRNFSFFKKRELKTVPIEEEPVKHYEEYTQEQLEIYNNVKPGDVIWALMPYSKERLAKIRDGHQIRPYLIVIKKDYKLYAYPLSSSIRTNVNYLRYPVNKDLYNVNKNSWISLNQMHVLPIKNIRSNYFTLKSKDIMQINHRLQVVDTVTKSNKKKVLFSQEQHLFQNDVVEDLEDLFYIFQCESNCAYGMPLFTYNMKDLVKVNIAGKKYYIDFNRQKKFNVINNDVKIIMIATYTENLKIHELEKKFKQERKVKKQRKKKKETYLEKLDEGCVYETKNGQKFICVLNIDNTSYVVDLFELDDNPRMMNLNKGSYRYLFTCENEEFYNILDKLMVSENIHNKYQEILLDKFYSE